VRLLVIASLLVALGVPAAHAGRQLTPAQRAQVLTIANRVKAERQAKLDRRRASSERKKRVRDAKMAAALEMAADYKADKARKKAAQAEARKREEGKRNAARLRFLEDLLRTRR
jgi:hypothetical protein